MSHWATPKMDRNQAVLFSPTLNDMLDASHPVRLFHEILSQVDFSQWESMYVRVAGQPPIHPQVMASAILYGLSLGIRSSRKLEDAAMNRLDFMWLLEGRTPDHSSFCGFRTCFEQQLKGLFRQIGHVGIEMGLVTLNQVMLDGTAQRANNSRFTTARKATLQQKRAALDEQIERLMREAREQDQAEDQLYGESSPAQLPRELRNLQRRQERLTEAMKNLEELEKTRHGRKDVSAKGPAIPLSDPDSRVLPNKEGGYAPNYTTVLATDGDSGMILDTQVLSGNNEASSVLPAVEHLQENFDRKPEQVVADSGFNSGPNLAGLTEAGVEPLLGTRQPMGAEVAVRPDPTEPVAVEKREQLPMNPQNKVLDRSAFIFDSARDCYFCPMGRTLRYTERKTRGSGQPSYRVYACGDCSGCPLAVRCLSKATKVRRVSRDEYEDLREANRRRLSSPAGQAQYKRRAPVAEGTFAGLKSRMHLRQFLLRGVKKVAQEVCWAATAYNIMKLAAHQVAELASGALARAE